MMNQDDLPKCSTSVGSSTGPIDQMFEHWLKYRIESGEIVDEAHTEWLKFTYFSACTDLYNLLMTTIKGDLTMRSLVTVSEAVRINVNTYLDSLPKQTLN